ncbi:hypothetical protein UFOVP1516_57 [uncultured Caudovirales phage]|uniref:Uncharacterized protein n=1 Tax=uncultured Caudovirales phage TaxID=2100421 RepID=A0A6J5PIL4_9CAUD|nr:hypothetical protein UFOVP887_78 [uncultured Caudovirales phage]CAB5226916.1 hypothetical protein UFOVP1516_57 [uncultured Caudovirales phage]
MRNIEGDRRARSLQLNPRPSSVNSKWKIAIAPPLSDIEHVRMERLQNFADNKARTSK